MRRDNDPVWLDQQYNNRALVPDFASHLEKWAKASAFTREQAACTLDLPYGDDATEKLDVFHTAKANAPVLVFIHGGYWRALDKSDVSFVAPAFNAAGAAVVVPNYALCPAVTVEHICLQVARAVAWVWRNAAAHGFDPTRIALAGHSAGGHLVAMALSCRWKELSDDLPAQPVTGALSI
ncbi:MAG: hypothetical protein RJA10_860, partial [Pseudomonadota bacterium]